MSTLKILISYLFFCQTLIYSFFFIHLTHNCMEVLFDENDDVFLVVYKVSNHPTLHLSQCIVDLHLDSFDIQFAQISTVQARMAHHYSRNLLVESLKLFLLCHVNFFH